MVGEGLDALLATDSADIRLESPESEEPLMSMAWDPSTLDAIPLSTREGCRWRILGGRGLSPASLQREAEDEASRDVFDMFDADAADECGCGFALTLSSLPSNERSILREPNSTSSSSVSVPDTEAVPWQDVP
jgi:hypothetical protein